jgi:nucleotide-binding universal stress UspA family protein
LRFRLAQGFSDKELRYIYHRNLNNTGMDSKIILVPTDFTPVAQNALEHALKVAESAQAKVNLLHIVPKHEMLDEAKEKLRLAKDMAKSDHGADIEVTARVGTIFEDIGDLAEELDATLVIMGTHGMKGLQFIIGSRALRVVTSASTPFVIVQTKGVGENGYDDIVVPLDLHKETKQKLSLVADMAKYFDSRVHIIVPNEKDEFLRNQVTRNLNYAESFFDEKKIPHTSKISDSDSDNFDKAIIKYAQEIDADLISIMNLPEISLSNLIGASYVQNIITNKHEIPVLLLNPKETTTVNIFGSYSGVG